MKQRSGTVFDTVQSKVPGRNWFDLSKDVKMSLDYGRLYPTLVQEVLPGDTFNISSQHMVRLMPMVAPVMHRLDVYQHFFFVPNRILWPNWENFITGGDDGTLTPAFPVLNLGDEGYDVGSLADYLTMPTGVGNLPAHSALIPAAYNMVWNEYFRDENLQAKAVEVCADGNGNDALLTDMKNKPRYRSWEHDYFTSCLPWAQKGDAVTLPLGTRADINFENPAIGTQVVPVTGPPVPSGPILGAGTNEVVDANGIALSFDNSQNLWADLSTATAATLNSLRNAEALQTFLEALARGGSRYTEVIRSFFGVTSSDSRLQRPEHFGGSIDPVAISEVLQTSSTDLSSPQGNMAGHGITMGSANGTYHAEEHGIILAFISIRPKTAYQQGINRFFSRKERLDFYWYQFAQLGEQEVLNKEVYAQGTSDDDETFGYIPRYAEYRYNSSHVAGQMRTTLSNWHEGRIFSNLPVLNQEFIECVPRKDIFAITDANEDSFIVHIWHEIGATRPIPKFAIPSL